MRKTIILLTLLLTACAPAATESPEPPTEAAVASTATVTIAPTEAGPTATSAPFVLTSGAIEDGGVIPDFYSCKGEDVSPDFDWGDPPAGTQSYVLIFNDPDAGGRGWVHWVIFNIPAEARRIGENVNEDADLPGGIQGTNSWGGQLYGGPCPPQGTTHNYVFTLYALDTVLDLDFTADRNALEAAMEGHVLAEISLSATFTR